VAVPVANWCHARQMGEADGQQNKEAAFCQLYF